MLSVVICTRNRIDALKQCLLFMIESARHFLGDWELIIVDNGSTTEISQEISTIAEVQLLPLVIIIEPLTGLSNARNRGLKYAKGEIIAFTDDDCWVDKYWLESIHDAFQQNKNVALVGGRVDLANSRDARVSIRSFDQDQPVVSLADIQKYLIGCNFAIRKSTVDAIGDFDPELGAGAVAKSAEDLDFFYRILMWGGFIYYSAACRVSHAHGRFDQADLQRQSANYIFGRGFWIAKRILMGDTNFWRHIYWEVVRECKEFRLRHSLYLLGGFSRGFIVCALRLRK
jgi:glycosyltransferase involved in cell wall biosynthesis